MKIMKRCAMILLLTMSQFATSLAALHKLEAVDSFGVDEKLTAPAAAKFVGLSSIAGQTVQGLLGAAISSKDKKPADILNELLQKHNVDVGRIFYERFREGLEKSRLSSKLNDSAANQFKLTVNEYGIGRAAGFGDKMHPYMTVRVQLDGSDGKSVWKKSAYMTNAYYKSFNLQSGDDWLLHPEHLEAAFAKVADFLVADLLKGV